MHSNSKTTIAIAVVVSALTGLLGGFLGGRLSGSSASIPSDLTVESLNAKSIVTRSLIAETDEEGVKCQISGGSIIASKAIVGAQLSGNIVAAKSIVASDKPATESLDKQHIVAELAAMPDCGGVLILRNQEGANTPAAGPVKAGQAIFLGYNKGGSPMAYTQDILQGDAGRAFFVRAIPGNKSSETAQAGQSKPNMSQPAGEQPNMGVAEGNPLPQAQPTEPAPRDPRRQVPTMAMPPGDAFRR